MHAPYLLTLFIPTILSFTTRRPNFAITAHLPPASSFSSIQSWNLTSYHIMPCYNYAVFTNATGRTFYANGTFEEISSCTSDILSDGGTPPWPWGTIITPNNETDGEGRRNVFINCGTGTPGVEVRKKRRNGPRVVYGEGEFYVCNSTLLFGPAMTLYYREKAESTPGNCADVVLRTKCVDDKTEREFQRDSWCEEL